MGKDITRVNTRIFIPCAGEGKRWPEFEGMPKQLVEIDGEPLLHRTVRCLKEKDLNDIFILGNNPIFKIDGVKMYSPHASRWIIETIKSTEPQWTENNIILLGDVWFSSDALNQIISTKLPIVVFGRKEGSKLTGCPWGEIFALVFKKTVASRVSHILNLSIAFAEKHGNKPHWSGRLWNFYFFYRNVYLGLPMPETLGEIDDRLFFNIDDFTEDFDNPIEYQQWKKNRAIYQKKNSKNKCYML